MVPGASLCSVSTVGFRTGWPRAVSRPGLPQTRTCAINAFGSSMNGLRVVPSGAHAANLLGLSTQVPAKIVYYTRELKDNLRYATAWMISVIEQINGS